MLAAVRDGLIDDLTMLSVFINHWGVKDGSSRGPLKGTVVERLRGMMYCMKAHENTPYCA